MTEPPTLRKFVVCISISLAELYKNIIRPPLERKFKMLETAEAKP